MTSHRATLPTREGQTQTATSKNSVEHSDYTERRNKSRRSKAAHPCITIRRGGPASGRPPTARDRRTLGRAGGAPSWC